jgi:hypothetical protein
MLDDDEVERRVDERSVREHVSRHTDADRPGSGSRDWSAIYQTDRAAGGFRREREPGRRCARFFQLSAVWEGNWQLAGRPSAAALRETRGGTVERARLVPNVAGLIEPHWRV